MSVMFLIKAKIYITLAVWDDNSSSKYTRTIVPEVDDVYENWDDDNSFFHSSKSFISAPLIVPHSWYIFALGK